MNGQCGRSAVSYGPVELDKGVSAGADMEQGIRLRAVTQITESAPAAATHTVIQRFARRLADRALQETVPLVGAAKMHLPAQHGVITAAHGHMRERRDAAVQYVLIRQYLAPERMAPGHEACARRHAERTVAVAGVKAAPFRGQGVQVRRRDDTVTIRARYPGGVLVRADEQDVGLFHAGDSPGAVVSRRSWYICQNRIQGSSSTWSPAAAPGSRTAKTKWECSCEPVSIPPLSA